VIAGLAYTAGCGEDEFSASCTGNLIVFDSQNLAFWDPVHGRDFAFVRDLLKGYMRNVHRAVSDDFVNWTEPVPLKYSDKVDGRRYTYGILPYERTPHILIAFPTEYTDRFAVAQVHPND